MATASGSDITVYWGDGSPPCWSILVALHEKQLNDYNEKMFSFDKKENKSAEVLAINPRGQLPCCRIGDLIINESLAVCLYLDEAYPEQGTQLMPRDARMRAQVWQRLSEFYWNFPRRCYTNYVKYLWFTPSNKRDSTRVQQAKEEFLAELEIWEGILREKQNTTFLFGDSFSMVDVMAFPWIAFLVALGLKLESRFEKIAAYYNFMKERPSMKKFWPKRWDGSPDTSVLSDI